MNLTAAVRRFPADEYEGSPPECALLHEVTKAAQNRFSRERSVEGDLNFEYPIPMHKEEEENADEIKDGDEDEGEDPSDHSVGSDASPTLLLDCSEELLLQNKVGGAYGRPATRTRLPVPVWPRRVFCPHKSFEASSGVSAAP